MVNGKPVIGLCSSYEKNEENDRIFLNHAYLDAIRHFGGMPLVIPAEAEEAEQKFQEAGASGASEEVMAWC